VARNWAAWERVGCLSTAMMVAAIIYHCCPISLKKTHNIIGLATGDYIIVGNFSCLFFSQHMLLITYTHVQELLEWKEVIVGG
jgi:hypothetical protein